MEIILFTIATESVKYLGINFPKVKKKGRYIENYKKLIKAIKDGPKDGNYAMFLGWKSQYSENEYTTQRRGYPGGASDK